MNGGDDEDSVDVDVHVVRRRGRRSLHDETNGGRRRRATAHTPDNQQFAGRREERSEMGGNIGSEETARPTSNLLELRLLRCEEHEKNTNTTTKTTAHVVGPIRSLATPAETHVEPRVNVLSDRKTCYDSSHRRTCTRSWPQTSCRPGGRST